MRKKKKKAKHKKSKKLDSLNSSNPSLQNEDESLQRKKKNKEEQEREREILEDEEDEELEEKYQIRTILTHKRFHYITTCFFSGLLFLIFLELSYLESFSSNLSFFILGFIFTGEGNFSF